MGFMEIGYGTRSVPTTLGLWLLPLLAGNMMANLTRPAFTETRWFICATVC